MFRGIYQDNGLVVFVDKRNKHKIQEWLRKYQSLVNKLAGSNYLQFTTTLWLPPPSNASNSPRRKDKKEMGVTVIQDSEFQFLDMRIK
eukprot:9289657-Ditylum_brightwellii.AAC.1